MTACPIRYQRQVPDRKGKIFYTSITSLSHISKKPGHEAAHGGRRSCPDRRRSCPAALRPVQLTDSEIHRRAVPLTGGGAGKEVLPFDY